MERPFSLRTTYIKKIRGAKPDDDLPNPGHAGWSCLVDEPKGNHETESRHSSRASARTEEIGQRGSTGRTTRRRPHVPQPLGSD
jgi:hypothetical protein